DWFREIRKLSENGHQTSVVTTHPQLSKDLIAEKMFSRWTQENFFKYMNENFDFDKMMEYGTEAVEGTLTLINPQYRKLTYQIKKAREKKRRLEARVYERFESKAGSTIE